MPDPNLKGRLRRALHDITREDRVARYAEGRAYASPVTLSGMNYPQAAAMGQQRPIRQWSNSYAHAIAQHAGLGVHAHRAVGDWSPPGHPEWAGAEPSTEFHFHNARDMDHIRYAASLIGKHSNQIQVLPFQEQKGGPHSMWHLHVQKAPADAIRSKMDEVGLPHRTIVPSSGHNRVVIYDQGDDPEVAKKINHVAKTFGSPQPHRIRGMGEFFPNVPEGDSHAQRTAAQPLYDKFIQEYENKNGLKPFTAPGIQHKVTSMQQEPAQYAKPQDPAVARKLQLHEAALRAQGKDPNNMLGGNRPTHIGSSTGPLVPGTHNAPAPAAKPRMVIPMHAGEPQFGHPDNQDNDADSTHPDQAAGDYQHPHPGAGSVYVMDKPRVRIPMEPAPRAGAAPGSQDAYNNGLIASAKRRRDPEQARELLQKAAGGGRLKPTSTTPARISPVPPAGVDPQPSMPGAPAPVNTIANKPVMPKPMPKSAALTQVPQGKLYPPAMHPAEQPPKIAGQNVARMPRGVAPPRQPVPLPAQHQYPEVKPPSPGLIGKAMQHLDSPQFANTLATGASKVGSAITAARKKFLFEIYEEARAKARYAGPPHSGLGAPAAEPAAEPQEYPKQAVKGPLGRSPKFLDTLGKPKDQEPSDDAYDVLHHQGHIVVLSKDKTKMHVIDARNPLDDTDLVNFHKNWKGAPSIAAKVEGIASQHRRMISADDNIHKMPPSPLNAIAGTPAESAMRGRMATGVMRAQPKPAAPAAAPQSQFPGRPQNQFAERPMPMAQRPWHKPDA